MTNSVFIVCLFPSNLDFNAWIPVQGIKVFQKKSSVCLGWMEIYGAGHSNSKGKQNLGGY